MRSPWDASSTSSRPSGGIGGDSGFDSGGVEHRLLGSLIERSTSAPPMSSEGDLHFGGGPTSVRKFLSFFWSDCCSVFVCCVFLFCSVFACCVVLVLC